MHSPKDLIGRVFTKENIMGQHCTEAKKGRQENLLDLYSWYFKNVTGDEMIKIVKNRK